MPAARFAELAAVKAGTGTAGSRERCGHEPKTFKTGSGGDADPLCRTRSCPAGGNTLAQGLTANSTQEKKRRRAEFWNKEETELRRKKAQQQRFLLKKDLADMAERVASLSSTGKERTAQATATASAKRLATAEAEFGRAEAALKTAQEGRNAGEMAAAQTEAKERALEQAHGDLEAFNTGEALCEQAKAAATEAEEAVREATRAAAARREAETNYRRLALLREQHAAAALARRRSGCGRSLPGLRCDGSSRARTHG